MAKEILCLMVVFPLLCLQTTSDEVNIAQKMIDAKIVPEMIRHPPKQLCRVFYDNVEVQPGDVLTCNQTIKQPTLWWPTEFNRTYFMLFWRVDRANEDIYTDDHLPRLRYLERTPINTYTHWVVNNIPGLNISNGTELYDYFPPDPPRYNGSRQRFVFLIYKQPKLKIDVEKLQHPQSK